MSPKTSSVYVALLRGINVGGKHKVPMQELAKLFAATDCSNIRTYIQSGNVVFTAPAAAVKRLESDLATRIEQRFGFPVPVVIRNRVQLDNVVRNNPFLEAGRPENTLHVCFLADEPSAEAVRCLDSERSVPDEFRVLAKEIYLYLPNGMGRSKLTSAYFDSKLSAVGTARNWATVQKLLDLMHA